MSYRLDLISGITRRFEPVREIMADNDKDAIAIAEEARSIRPAELRARQPHGNGMEH